MASIIVVSEIELGDGSNFDIKDSAAHALLEDHEERLLSAESKINAMYEDTDYLNQNAFSYVQIQKSISEYDIISADTQKDVVTFVPGSNVSITADVDNDILTFSAIDTTYDLVSTTAPGLCPTRPGDSNVFLRGDGAWGSPSIPTHLRMISSSRVQ